MDLRINERDFNRFADALEYAELAYNDIYDITYNEFISNRQLIDATIRRVEIVGEALGHISEETKMRYPEVPYKSARGMRDILAHAYSSIKLDYIYETIIKDFPDLISKIQDICNADKMHKKDINNKEHSQHQNLSNEKQINSNQLTIPMPIDLSAPKPTNKTSELTFKHFKDAATSEASAKQNETHTGTANNHINEAGYTRL
jgi:uncharacterized protein with HEPN domain